MKKRFVKIFSFLMVFLILVSSLPLVLFAVDGSDIEDIDTSDVYTDLEKMGFDLSVYPKNEKSDYVSIIDFLEYGYDHAQTFSDYGLYLYIYNPSGKSINSLYVYNNTIQLQTVFGTVESGYKKYCLQLIDASDNEGLENVFLKFKVLIPDMNGFALKLSPSLRKYQIADIELRFSGDISRILPCFSSCRTLSLASL